MDHKSSKIFRSFTQELKKPYQFSLEMKSWSFVAKFLTFDNSLTPKQKLKTRSIVIPNPQMSNISLIYGYKFSVQAETFSYTNIGLISLSCIFLLKYLSKTLFLVHIWLNYFIQSAINKQSQRTPHTYYDTLQLLFFCAKDE